MAEFHLGGVVCIQTQDLFEQDVRFLIFADRRISFQLFNIRRVTQSCIYKGTVGRKPVLLNPDPTVHQKQVQLLASKTFIQCFRI